MDSTEKRYETIRKRLEALWENEILDRCCVSVLAPRDPQRPYRENPPESQEDLCRWYNDAQWIQERNLERIRRTYCGRRVSVHFSVLWDRGTRQVYLRRGEGGIQAGYHLDSPVPQRLF